MSCGACKGTFGDVVACDDGAAAALDVGDHDGAVGSTGQLVVERPLELFFNIKLIDLMNKNK